MGDPVVGERGEKGDQGQHGQSGDPGATGARGERGKTGAGRFALIGYIILTIFVVFSLGVLTRTINHIENLREQRVKDAIKTEKVICERSVTNARINLEQNERLTRLLILTDRSRRSLPSYPTEFDKESVETIHKARQENEILKEIADEDCKNLPSSRPFEN